MDAGGHDIMLQVNQDNPSFPWRRLERLLMQSEVFLPQVEDDYNTANIHRHVEAARNNPGHLIWLVTQGTSTLGFLSLEVKSQVWGIGHIGFRSGVSGLIKKRAVEEAINSVFGGDNKIATITLMIPEFNRGACILAGACGFVREGRIAKSFLKGGVAVDQILFNRRRTGGH